MEKVNFTADELSELEALQILGGATDNPLDPMAQTACANKALGCGSGTDQLFCINETTGCGSDVYLGALCVTQRECF